MRIGRYGRVSLNRRSFLQVAALGLGGRGLRGDLAIGRELSSPSEIESYGVSPFGILELPQGFKHFRYVNPTARKGGMIVMLPRLPKGNQNPSTFNTVNMYTFKGDGAAGMESTFDSLMVENLDERNALYGLVAHSVRVSADRLRYSFVLRREAAFHDGSPLTARDVVFSLTLIKRKGHPIYQSLVEDMESAVAESPDVVTVRFSQNRSRDAHVIVASLPIFSEAYWKDRDFESSTLEPPLGSGPYKVSRLEQGKFIEFERARDYWAKTLPVNIGLHNFDTVRYEYFRDQQVAFEAFKTGSLNFREELNTRQWATGYDFPAAKTGRVVKKVFPNKGVVPIAGWFFNLRRSKFSDKKIREAICLAFDFEWTNKNIMFSGTERVTSYFEGSDMKASGLPTPNELALLDPFRGNLAKEVFGEPYLPPISDGSGSDRDLLARAALLLREAGCSITDGNIRLPNGQPLEVEFLNSSTAIEAQTLGFVSNLRRLGIAARSRIVDPVQFTSRREQFDFDVMPMVYAGSLTPGPELRSNYGSRAAETAGTRNAAGIRDASIDAMLDRIADAGSPADLITACRCLDRILRAGIYWVPLWYRAGVFLAYWDTLSHTDDYPRYAVGAPATWWSSQA